MSIEIGTEDATIDEPSFLTAIGTVYSDEHVSLDDFKTPNKKENDEFKFTLLQEANGTDKKTDGRGNDTAYDTGAGIATSIPSSRDIFRSKVDGNEDTLTKPPMDIIHSNSDDEVVSPLLNKSSLEHDHVNIDIHDHQHMNERECECQSIRTLNQHTIDLNLRLDEPANIAFVYIKPHGKLGNANNNTNAIKELVHDTLLDHINPYIEGSIDIDGGIGGAGRIVAEYDISSEIVEQGKFFDKHFKSLARYAVEIAGSDLSASAFSEIGFTRNSTATSFREQFGEGLDLVKKESRIYNAREALSALACTPGDLDEMWQEAQKDSSKGKIKYFGNGLYCGNLFAKGKNVYVMNGFYMAMRAGYVQPGMLIHAYIIQWSPNIISWKEFRKTIIGAEDPSLAEAGSLRRMIYDKYSDLGLDARPDEINNVIHASSSPLEALSERLTWCSKEINQDEYGRILLGRGIPESKILDWCDNIKVPVRVDRTISGPKGKRKKKAASAGAVSVCKSDDGFLTDVFDVVKDMDAKKCADKLTEIYDYELFGPRIEDHARCRSGECCIIS